jgi:hypothetical protein
LLVLGREHEHTFDFVGEGRVGEDHVALIDNKMADLNRLICTFLTMMLFFWMWQYSLPGVPTRMCRGERMLQSSARPYYTQVPPMKQPVRRGGLKWDVIVMMIL